MMDHKRFGYLFIAVVIAIFLAAPAMSADKPLELKMSSAFELQRHTSMGARMLIERINKAAAGKLQIKYVGGPEAIPPFEQSEALRKGVVDIIGSPGSYYSASIPEGGCMYLSQITPQQERQNGAHKLLQDIAAKKGNAFYLGRYNTTYKFNFYSKVPVEKMADFKGLPIRVSPVYRAFLKELGAVPINMAHSEIYTALERGVVKAMGGTNFDIMDKGWHEHLKYIIDPPFYGSDTSFLVNLDVWKKLSPELQKLFVETNIQIEKESGEELLKIIKKEREDMVKYGLKVTTIAEPDKYTKIAYDAAWKEILAKSPEYGPQLQKLLSK